ncbi:MAG TPA: Gfo/Idh/MocA family oxidoreductase [Phycisphaerae bacterium]|nr:Gfo/Idh/MocA family oxidoreductase [Phycisphaerae bacterium]
MARLRTIVVGAGGIAGAWFPAFAKEKVKVVAVVDLARERAEKRIEEFKLADALADDDLEKTLRDRRADFLVDLTVPEAHCAVTCAALRAGLHVIGEKPMASSMAEARRMVRTSEAAGRLYMVSQSRRWDAKHDALRRTVAAGRLGTLTTVHCDFFVGAHFGGFRDKMESPLVLDMAIHHFDMARMVSGCDPVAVYCEEFNPAGSWYKGDSSANAVFQMTDGVRFAYRGSWCAEGCDTSWNGNWRFIGTQGTILYENDCAPTGELVAGRTGFSRPKKAIAVRPVAMKADGMHGALREMIAFLRTRRKPQCESHDNIKSLAMVFAAIESSRKGRRIPVRAL